MLRVSVVVPTCRRPDFLTRCLGALVAQDLHPADYEIIIVDDACSDATRAQVATWLNGSSCGLTYLGSNPNSGGTPDSGGTGGTPGGTPTGVSRLLSSDRIDSLHHGPAAARNRGWRAAQAPIVAFTDDDCVPAPNWLSAGLAHFERAADLLAISGRVHVPLGPAPTDYERDAAGLENAEFVTANCFCRRAALEAVGGFDERFETAWREDSDLHFALLSLPGKVQKTQDAVVIHPVRPASWGVSLKQQRKALFDALLYKKHPDYYRKRIRPGTPWHYYAMVGALGAGGLALGCGEPAIALACVLLWAFLTGSFCLKRLHATSRAPGHVAEMVFTSIMLPYLSVFWRLYGAYKFRVFFL